ncbi:MAG: imidazoleglycerol-phosphate dehydratase HisB [Chloroflexota bacterium]
MSRTGTAQRETTETQVTVTWELDGVGHAEVQTGIGFLDHMLTHVARHGRFDLQVRATGDLHLDAHHTAEDVGLTMGQALTRALVERRGIRRMGHAIVPMDEALALVAVDLSGRPYTVCDLPLRGEMLGTLPAEVVEHVLLSLATEGRFNLHARLLAGTNDHHKVEAVFKALARALDEATALDARLGDVIPSTKGTL